MVLILHGSLADARALLPFQVLEDRYHVVMWDQRGNGLSERITPEEYSEESIVAEIAAVKAHVAPDRPVALVGHSFGAMYSVLYTSRRPADVWGLVLMEPAGLNGEIFTETASEIVNTGLLLPGLNQLFWQNEVITPSDHAQADRRALMMLLDGELANYHCDPEQPIELPVWRPGALIEVVRADVIGQRGAKFEYDFATGIEQFTPEVLLLAGSCSVLGPEFQTTYHLPLFADPRLVEIDGVGHRMFVEDFEAVLAPISAYLDTHAETVSPAP